MNTLYLDILSGISGDMFIGALIDLGVDLHKLEHKLEKLKLEGFHLHATRQLKSAIEGVKFDDHLAHSHSHEREPAGVQHSHPHTHEHEHDHGHHHHDHAHEYEHHHPHEP